MVKTNESLIINVYVLIVAVKLVLLTTSGTIGGASCRLMTVWLDDFVFTVTAFSVALGTGNLQ